MWASLRKSELVFSMKITLDKHFIFNILDCIHTWLEYVPQACFILVIQRWMNQLHAVVSLCCTKIVCQHEQKMIKGIFFFLAWLWYKKNYTKTKLYHCQHFIVKAIQSTSGAILMSLINNTERQVRTEWLLDISIYVYNLVTSSGIQLCVP